MNAADEDEHEVEDLQTDVTRFLLGFVHAPLLGDQYVRGVLPAPEGAPAVRGVLGGRDERAPARLTADEIPLGPGTELLTPHDAVGLLRAARTEPGR
ncbi:hypothetical protein [Streptomyces yaizuensis]|uniref:Uncharacterized protein n=1 Tax=Streptomyces yaizuensis TaxID=2989713 RepID=A0ABQ5P6F2_9ACTN|nr:hypothetical protein [Streptomyces sp. YSPA8]GLF98157.1 hypothetical protein SYYSPA8_27690 [Streptomyces sp. YSPA8]